MIVYKVVTGHKDSCLHGYMSSNARVQPYYLNYKIGERTSAPRGTIGIFVFRQFHDAEWFAKALSPRRFILKVKTDKRYIKKPMVVAGWLSPRFYPVKEQLRWVMHVPDGTITVPSIIPISEAYNPRKH